MTMRKVNIITSILILALCLLFWTDAANIRPPAHIYPKSVIIIAAFLAFVLLIQSIFFPKALVQGKPFAGTKYGRVLTTISSVIAYYFAIKIIGFFVSSFFFLILLIWLLGDRSIGLKVFANLGGLSLVVMGLIYVSFKMFLKVPTPPGILF